MKSPICELLGIEKPVFQGGMAWVADASLAAGVSNGGGLGIIAAMNATGEDLRKEIQEARRRTSKPFGVNLMLQSPWIKEAVEVVCQERVKVVTTGAGNPSAYMEKLKEAGILVIPLVASVAQAKQMERLGACGVIAEGCESGGHVGETTTMALVPQVVDEVNIPVIAAGGIGDARGMAAAFMLGAVGVQMGTRFLTAEECTIHENYKEMILKAKDIDTIVTGKSLGHPVRALKNAMTREFSKKEMDPDTSPEELLAMGAGGLRMAAREGKVKEGSCMAGQIAGLVHERGNCKEILNQICRETQDLLLEGKKWVG